MKHEQYTIEASSQLLKYEFYSNGPKGRIKKQVLFKEFEDNPTVWNLGFGDVDSNGEISDTVITNNNDSKKVIATVALTIYKFFEIHKGHYVFVTGNTKSRTRLYRIGIANNLHEIQDEFEVYGFIRNSWEIFALDTNYDAFLIKKKR